MPVSIDVIIIRDDTIMSENCFSGHETKAMLNNGGPRYKRSKLERQMNTDVMWCVLLLLVLCCVGAFGCKLWYDQYAPAKPTIYPGSPYNNSRQLPPFIPNAADPSYEGLLSFWTFIIILQVRNRIFVLCIIRTF
jgi:phospholipid-translocating ATPase